MARHLVAIELFRERLRLRWSWQGKRMMLPIGPDGPLTKKVAQTMAAQIEADIISRNYDPTLKKYRIQETKKAIAVVDLYQKHCAKKFSGQTTCSKHKALAGHIKRGFGARSAASVNEEDAIEFLDGLTCGNSTKNTYLIILRAAWKGIDSNPWLDVTVDRAEDAPEADPFTHDEVEKILAGFAGTHYLLYVKGLFGLGCRPGELSALQWDDIDFGRRLTTINKSWNDRTRKVKCTKTGKIRKVPMGVRFEEFLREIQPKQFDPGTLVFPAVKGGHLEAHNFLNRHWKPTLEQVGVRYRPTYTTRHTVWSHAIAEGMPIAEAAKNAGNRPETMTRHYLGAVTQSAMPDLI
jgi:integrase